MLRRPIEPFGPGALRARAAISERQYKIENRNSAIVETTNIDKLTKLRTIAFFIGSPGDLSFYRFCAFPNVPSGLSATSRSPALSQW